MTGARTRHPRAAGRPAPLTAFVIAVVAGLLLGGCGDDASAELTIVDFGFEPAELEVAAGSTVQVSNADGARHTVTAEDATFDLSLDGGASGSFTVDAPGSYAYACAVHPSMTGTLVVD